MRIAYLITRGDDIGGAQVHVRDLASGLLRRGHEVTVLTGGHGKFSSELNSLGIAHRSIPNLVMPIAPAKDLLATVEIARALRSIQPDLVAAHTAKAGLLGRIACAALGYPVTFTPHGWSIGDRISARKGKLFRRVESLASLIPSRIINVCDYEVDLALKARVARPHKLAMVYNGLPAIEESLRADVSTDPPRLVMIARMAEPKDHATLLQALAGLKHLAWTLDLVGDGPFEAKLRAQAANLGITGRVNFVGFSDQPAQHLADAQVFVLSSRSEAFPYSVLEAMRAGLPVVATAVGGIPEAVIHARTGLLAQPSHMEELRAQLAAVIGAPALRKTLGDQGRTRFEEHFTFDKMLLNTLTIYQEILTEYTPKVRATSPTTQPFDPDPIRAATVKEP
jgi:glycosyltransferase involved in cell wall biosynthesis